jgi:hypothetical protein
VGTLKLLFSESPAGLTEDDQGFSNLSPTCGAFASRPCASHLRRPSGTSPTFRPHSTNVSGGFNLKGSRILGGKLPGSRRTGHHQNGIPAAQNSIHAHWTPLAEPTTETSKTVVPCKRYRGFESPLFAQESQERDVSARHPWPGFRVFGGRSGAGRWQTPRISTATNALRRTRRHHTTDERSVSPGISQPLPQPRCTLVVFSGHNNEPGMKSKEDKPLRRFRSENSRRRNVETIRRCRLRS